MSTPAVAVAREQARVRRLVLAWGVALALAGVAMALGLGVLAFAHGRWMTLPAWLPFVVWTAVVFCVGLVAVFIRQRVAVEAAQARVADAIEQDHRLRRGALRGVLEVGDEGALGRRGAAQIGGLLADRPILAPTLRRRMLVRSGAVTAIALVAILGLGASAVTAPEGWHVMAHPVRAWRGALLAPLRIEVVHDIARGQTARVRVVATGRQQVTVWQRATGVPWIAATESVHDGMVAFVTSPVDADLTLVATDGRAVSDTVVIRAVDRPFVGAVTMRAEYPAYLQRANDVLPVGEAISVPRGTRLTIAGNASVDLATIALIQTDTIAKDQHVLATDALHAAGHRFSGQLVADEEAAGHWEWRAAARGARGAGEPISDVPAPVDLTVIPDSAPTIVILAPPHDTVISPDDHFPVSLAASDDHGITSVVLHLRRVTGSGVPQPEAVQSVAENVGGRWTGDAIIEAAARGLQSGDVLHVTAEVTDNSPWRQTGHSAELLLRVPTLNEQRTLVRHSADSLVSHLTATTSAERDLEQQTEDAARARGQRPTTSSGSSNSNSGSYHSPNSMSYDAAEQARALGKDQRQLSQRIDSLNQQTQELKRQLQRVGALDSGLASRLAQAQQLLQQALTPDLQSQLDQLDKSAQSLQSSETRQSLSDLAQQQRQVRDQLERATEMLKRAALEGSMQTLRDEAKDIAKAERGQASSPNARTDQQLADRSRTLSHDIDQLSKRLNSAQAKTGAQQVGQAQSTVDSSAQSMDQHQASNAASQMDRAAQQLANARQNQVGEWKSAITNTLDQSVQETMQMAQQEQDLARQAQNGNTGKNSGASTSKSAPSDDSLTAQQSAIQQGINQTAQRLQHMAQQSALVSPGSQQAVGQAQAKVQQATQALRDAQSGSSANRNEPSPEAANAMRDAAQALMNAAGAMAHDRDRAGRASSSSGLAEMLQQMRQLAQQQGQLSAQGSGLLSGGKNGGSGTGASALAAGERKIANALDQMPGSGNQTGTGDAEALAKEARQIAEALERSGVDSGTAARQDRLYHHLLDAGHTLEQDERDSTGKRVSQSATGRESYTPTNTVASGRAATRYPEPAWSELRDLSADERQMVIDYFRRINASH